LQPERVSQWREDIHWLEQRLAEPKKLLTKIEKDFTKGEKDFSFSAMPFQQLDRRPKIGMIGTLQFDTTAKRIIDEQNMLVEVEYVRAQRDAGEVTKTPVTELLWIQGYPTKNAAEGKMLTLEGVFEISEKKTLDEPPEGRNDVFVLTPIDLSKFEVFFKR